MINPVINLVVNLAIKTATNLAINRVIVASGQTLNATGVEMAGVMVVGDSAIAISVVMAAA